MTWKWVSCAANARLTEARVTNKAGDLSALAYKSCHVSSRRDKSVYTGGGSHTLFGLSANMCVVSNFTQVRSLYLVNGSFSSMNDILAI